MVGLLEQAAFHAELTPYQQRFLAPLRAIIEQDKGASREIGLRGEAQGAGARDAGTGGEPHGRPGDPRSKGRPSRPSAVNRA